MNQPAINSPRKATNVSINEALLVAAKSLKINVSQAAEVGIALALAEKRAALWLQENQAALDSSNAYVEKQGLPLAQYRAF